MKKKGLSERDLAYMAGFFDGEGCIQIQRRRQPHPTKRRYYAIHVSVSQTTEYIPRWFCFNFGGSVHKSKHTKEKRSWDVWTWQAVCRDAGAFLGVIHPHLILKKPQAELALKMQATKRFRGKPLSDEETAVEEAQYLLMRNLNKKHGKGRQEVIDNFLAL